MMFVTASENSPIRHVCLLKKEQLPAEHSRMSCDTIQCMCECAYVCWCSSILFHIVREVWTDMSSRTTSRASGSLTNACNSPLVTLTLWHQSVQFCPAPLLDDSKIFLRPRIEWFVSFSLFHYYAIYFRSQSSFSSINDVFAIRTIWFSF